MTLDLPTGPRGRLLAVGLTAVTVLVIVFGILAPMRAWYVQRAEALAQRAMLARRMTTLSARLPELQRAASGPRPGAAAPDALIPGGSDAVAAAALQERVQAMATRAGTALSSVEILPAAKIGQFRRIGLHVAVQADMAKVVRLLEAIDQARPRMLVDDLDLQRHLLLAKPNEPDLDAKFVVYAFRAGEG